MSIPQAGAASKRVQRLPAPDQLSSDTRSLSDIEDPCDTEAASQMADGRHEPDHKFRPGAVVSVTCRPAVTCVSHGPTSMKGGGRPAALSLTRRTWSSTRSSSAAALPPLCRRATKARSRRTRRWRGRPSTTCCRDGESRISSLSSSSRVGCEPGYGRPGEKSPDSTDRCARRPCYLRGQGASLVAGRCSALGVLGHRARLVDGLDDRRHHCLSHPPLTKQRAAQCLLGEPESLAEQRGTARP